MDEHLRLSSCFEVCIRSLKEDIQSMNYRPSLDRRKILGEVAIEQVSKVLCVMGTRRF